MPVRTNNEPRYYRRFQIMGVIALGFALYCLYDGFIGYPNQRERALAFHELETELGQDPVAFRDRWHEVARENNWDTEYPGEPKSEGDIIMQFVMAAGSAAVGLWLLGGAWLARGRWIESTDSGIHSSWGQNFRFDQIVALNKRKWRDKGIAKVTYEENGRKRRFVIDDYKFDRYLTDGILRELEANIDPALITGGPPEAALDAPSDATVRTADEGTIREN